MALADTEPVYVAVLRDMHLVHCVIHDRPETVDDWAAESDARIVLRGPAWL